MMPTFTTENKISNASEVRQKIPINKEIPNEDFGDLKSHKPLTKELPDTHTSQSLT